MDGENIAYIERDANARAKKRIDNEVCFLSARLKF